MSAPIENLCWAQPQPIIEKKSQEPYPLDALPPTLRALVEEIVSYMQSPLVMVASSAISAISVAAQAQFDVKRANKLSGPISVMSLNIAESGERKSALDKILFDEIRKFESEQQHLSRLHAKKIKINKKTIQSKVLEEVEGVANSKICEYLTEENSQKSYAKDSFEDGKKFARLIYQDVTPEALVSCLDSKWPSGGVIAAEGGLVFGSHGMGGDSVLRNFAVLNQLWDSGSVKIDRKTTESHTVENSRLTVSIQVQEGVLLDFFRRTGSLARDTGFMARFLLSKPSSTQGTRFFVDPPEMGPNLNKFNLRIKTLLERQIPLCKYGNLNPKIMSLSVGAKQKWVDFYNQTEVELGAGGLFDDIKDVASKIGENAARVAAIFQVYESDESEVSSENMERAIRIVYWHLLESQSFFSNVVLPISTLQLIKLNDWLIGAVKKFGASVMTINFVRQRAPAALRESRLLLAKLGELEKLHRIHIFKFGKSQQIELNPALLDSEN